MNKSLKTLKEENKKLRIDLKDLILLMDCRIKKLRLGIDQLIPSDCQMHDWPLWRVKMVVSALAFILNEDDEGPQGLNNKFEVYLDEAEPTKWVRINKKGKLQLQIEYEKLLKKYDQTCERIVTFEEVIKHGDKDHQKWLKEMISKHFTME